MTELTETAAPALPSGGIDFADMDVAAASETPFEFELKHPATHAPLGVFVSVFGPESAAFKAKIFADQNRERRRIFEQQRKGRPPEPKTMEEDTAAAVKLIGTLVAGWRTVRDGKSEPVIVWGKERLECTTENVVRWLTHFSWVRKQVDEASGDIENFIAG